MQYKQSLKLPNKFCFNFRNQFTNFYQEAIEANAPTQIELDFSHVNFIDSAALGMLVLLHRDVSPKNVQVTIKGAKGVVGDILDMAKMSQYFYFEA